MVAIVAGGMRFVSVELASGSLSVAAFDCRFDDLLTHYREIQVSAQLCNLEFRRNGNLVSWRFKLYFLTNFHVLEEICL